MEDKIDMGMLAAIFILITVIGFVGNSIFLYVYGYFHPLVWDNGIIAIYSVLEAIIGLALGSVGR